MVIKETGSVRIDLLGGTLDLEPINLILPHALTLNAATSLQATVTVEPTEHHYIEVHSLDYQDQRTFSPDDFTEDNFASNFFGPLRFVANILHFFRCHQGLKVTLSSGSPAGAGLGGSSTMGVTLYKALLRLKNETRTAQDIIADVRRIEAEDLKCGPTGYQDYYPALYGGILALTPGFAGVQVGQLYTKELAQLMSEHMSLIFSGQTRLSGINNWEVYKAFFDDDGRTRRGLHSIAELSLQAYQCLERRDYQQFFELIKKEGEVRASLFPDIMTDDIRDLLEQLKTVDQSAGVKMCGAGGGGCFLIVHGPAKAEPIASLVQKHQMSKIGFTVSPPVLKRDT